MIDRENKQQVSVQRAYEVMDDVLRRGDAGELARLYSVSPQLVRAWCRRPETEDEFATGKFGPLDRLRTLILMVRGDDGTAERAYPIGNYIASMLGGTFVPVPVLSGDPDDEIMLQLGAILKETGEAIEAARLAWFVDRPGEITKKQGGCCVKEIDEAIVSLLQLRSWVEMRAK